MAKLSHAMTYTSASTFMLFSLFLKRLVFFSLLPYINLTFLIQLPVDNIASAISSIMDSIEEVPNTRNKRSVIKLHLSFLFTRINNLFRGSKTLVHQQ